MSLWYVIVPLCVWILGQWLKVIIDVSKGQKFSLSSIWTSGGFPSTHGILTSSVLTMLALYEGMDTSLFMVAAIFSLLIRYGCRTATMRWCPEERDPYDSPLTQRKDRSYSFRSMCMNYIWYWCDDSDRLLSYYYFFFVYIIIHV